MSVDNGASVSIKAKGEAYLQFGTKYLDLENVYFILNYSRNLISVSKLAEQSYGISFNNSKIFISKNSLHLCFANLEDGLYVLKPYETFHIALNFLK